ncbi:MAG: winged helix-turn-helix domain-containing protein, partial [Rubrivivax sp.]|nr:winged helix-turn-helix domain-containing protein [Rubrivivax sp.]
LLHMSREEMGSYLGLKLETVSRSFSKLQLDGVLEVHHRRIQVLDAAALARVAHGPAA